MNSGFGQRTVGTTPTSNFLSRLSLRHSRSSFKLDRTGILLVSDIVLELDKLLLRVLGMLCIRKEGISGGMKKSRRNGTTSTLDFGASFDVK